MKILYISGAISDPQTGLPREGWQQQFTEAEERLRGMGFGVINPTVLSGVADAEWQQMAENDPALPHETPRWFYLQTCLDTMCDALRNAHHGATTLAGLYLIGDKQPLRYSHGVQAEIHMAKSMGLPLFMEFYHGTEVDEYLLPVKDGLLLEPGGTFGKERWSRCL